VAVNIIDCRSVGCGVRRNSHRRSSAVKEAVALVDNDHLGIAQRVRAFLVIVDQPSRCADEEIGATFENLPLLAIIEPAENDVGPNAGVMAEALGITRDLDRELAGGRHDQCSRRLGGGFSGGPQNVGEDRQQVGGGLARTRLRLCHDVLPLE